VRLSTLCAATKQDVLRPFPEDVNPGEAASDEAARKLLYASSAVAGIWTQNAFAVE